MIQLADTQSLTKVTLNVKYLDWHPTQIIQFARDNPRLRLLIIEGEQQHKKINFGKKYQNLFTDLVKERGKITIKILIYQDDREVEISEKGFSDKTRSESLPDGEAQDPIGMMNRIQEMMAHMNKNLFD